ncbi:MAG: hypothetical protein AAGA75_04320 [Cyanobacteria bacterium P01_E01_bin.6]
MVLLLPQLTFMLRRTNSTVYGIFILASYGVGTARRSRSHPI